MGQPLGVGCRKGCSSLALLPVLPWHVLGEQGVPQTPSPQCVNTVPHRAEPEHRKLSPVLTAFSPGLHPCRVLL